MKGEVVLVNPENGMAALMVDGGGYTSFEVLGGEVECGDVISGDLESLGGETWRNETQMEDLDVFVEDIHGSRSTARQLIS